MSEQLLQIGPKEELKFRGPITSPTRAFLHLSNPSKDKRVCYKIMAMKAVHDKYVVKPNGGILGPLERVKIEITFKGYAQIPKPSTLAQHKFVVQSLLAPEGEFDLTYLWVQSTKSSIIKSRIKCVFEEENDADFGSDTTDSESESTDVSTGQETKDSANSLEKVPEVEEQTPDICKVGNVQILVPKRQSFEALQEAPMIFIFIFLPFIFIVFFLGIIYDPSGTLASIMFDFLHCIGKL